MHFAITEKSTSYLFYVNPMSILDIALEIKIGLEIKMTTFC